MLELGRVHRISHFCTKLQGVLKLGGYCLLAFPCSEPTHPQDALSPFAKLYPRKSDLHCQAGSTIYPKSKFANTSAKPLLDPPFLQCNRSFDVFFRYKNVALVTTSKKLYIWDITHYSLDNVIVNSSWVFMVHTICLITFSDTSSGLWRQ